MNESAKSTRQNNLIIRSESRESTAPSLARRMESRFDLGRRQLTVARRVARVIGPFPEDATAESPVVEYEAAPAAQTAQAGGKTALEELLSPFTLEEFFGEQEVRARPVLLRGETERFAKLTRWPDLNALLTTGKLEANDVRMVVDGTDLARDLFTATVLSTGGRQRDEHSRKVDGKKVRALAAQGATLIVDEADLYLNTVSELAKSFESAMATYSRINLYASWRSLPGFETHWDDHDVFVIQTRGEKVWRVLGPTRIWPTREDTNLDEVPPKEPLWTGRVSAGDVLYIPRGWWHDARVAGEHDGQASVHLTCQVRMPSGRDLLSWLGERLQQETLFRRPAPVWAGETAFADYLEQMKSLIDAELERVEASKSIQALRSRWTERAPPGLGAWVEPWKDSEWPLYRLRLLGWAHAEYAEEGETIRLTVNGWAHTLESRARGVVLALMDNEETIVEIVKEAGIAGGAKTREIESLLALWIQRGVLIATSPHD